MPSKVVTSHTTAVSVFTTPGNKKAVIERIICADAGAVGALITVQDIFTPDASSVTTSPTLKTESRVVLAVAANALVDINQSEGGEGIEIFGECKILGSTIDADLHITVVWKYL